MQDHVLRAKANEFAADINNLLNNTVCDGISVSAYVVNGKNELGDDDRLAKIALGSVDPAPIPLTLGKRPSGYLSIAYSLRPDSADKHLMVVSSFIGLYLDEQQTQILCHFDYEREKKDYPEAHIQVCGESQVWDDWLAARGANSRPMSKAHFPVGGRRNRTSLEDVVEFLICEGLVSEVRADDKDGALSVCELSRAAFRERQLRAAVRRQPKIAISELETLGLI